jgi:hypothetical protein
MKQTLATIGLFALSGLLLAAGAGDAQAGDFDGSKKLICAPVQGMDCSADTGCSKGIAADMGAPTFLRVDVAAKRIAGTKVTTDILTIEKSDTQILLGGNEMGFGWVMAIDSENGEMVTTMTSRASVFMMFGNCTPI